MTRTDLTKATDATVAIAMPVTPVACPEKILIIACGALAHELVFLKKLNHWAHMDIQCLPAELHNTPKKIPDAVANKIFINRDEYSHLFIGYADCGTGGLLDALLEKENKDRAPHQHIQRIAGAHCYEFMSGTNVFERLAEDEVGTFYLTDFLARHFQRIIIRGLKIDQHPELLSMYFANYTKLVYLAQTENPEIEVLARQAAEDLQLSYEKVSTGLDPFEEALTVGVKLAVKLGVKNSPKVRPNS